MRTAVVSAGRKHSPEGPVPAWAPFQALMYFPRSGLCVGTVVWLEPLQPQLWPGPHLPAPGAAETSPAWGQLSVGPAP